MAMRRETFIPGYQGAVRLRAVMYPDPTAEIAMRNVSVSRRTSKEKPRKQKKDGLPSTGQQIDEMIAAILHNGEKPEEPKLTREIAIPLWNHARSLAHEINRASLAEIQPTMDTTDIPSRWLPLENPNTISLPALVARIQERQADITILNAGLRAGNYLARLDEVTPNNPEAWNLYQKEKGDVVAPKKWLQAERHVPELKLLRSKMNAAVTAIQR